MTSKPKIRMMSNKGNRIQRSDHDIVASAINNDFAGVERALNADPESINAQWSGNGITALMAASGRGLELMVQHLLSKPNIDVSAVDDFGKDALQHGRMFPNIVSHLMRHTHPNLKWKEPGFFPV